MENKENVNQETPRRIYERPALEEWGTVADLTNTGVGTGGDPLGGSVDCFDHG